LEKKLTPCVPIFETGMLCSLSFNFCCAVQHQTHTAL
jgi:hypothetical protein